MCELIKKCRCSTNLEGDKFVGLVYNKEEKDFKIVFPLGYDIPCEEGELKKSIFNLLNSISLTKATLKNASPANSEFKDKFITPFYSYYNLIIDYLNNGLISYQEKQFNKIQSGKLNWKKTIQRETPIYYNNSFIYNNIFYENSRVIENDIMEIEKFCLKEALYFLSWNFENIFIGNSKYNKRHKDNMLFILNKELNITFNDHKKDLLINMINIIKGLDEQNNKQIYYYGTNSFNIVWEKIIDDTFSNYDSTLLTPNVKWCIIGEKADTMPPLRIDSILFNEQDVFILDSKYYHYCDTKNIQDLPSTSDVGKQIIYGEYVEEKLKNEKKEFNNIYNAFILPFKKQNNVIEYLGYSESNWTCDNNQKYHKIALIMYDTKTAIDNWINGIKNRNNLCETIKDNIDKIE